MSFVEDAPTKNYSETRKRTSDSYVKFVEGEKIVLRMLDDRAKKVWKHWVGEANGGKGMMAVCPNVEGNRICPIDNALKGLAKDDPKVLERKAKARWMANVLDRTPVTQCQNCETITPGKVCKNCGVDIKKNEFVPLNKVKILEGGPRLFRETIKGIEELQLEEFEKEITEYDITFSTKGAGRDRKIAAVPQTPEPVDESWLIDPETGEPQKLFDLDLLAEPTSVEEIEAMLRGATLDELNAIRGVV